MTTNEERLPVHTIEKLLGNWVNPLRALVLGAVTLLALPSASAHAQALPQETPEQAQRMADSLFVGKFAIDDADPERSVPTSEARDASPLDFATLLMDLGERADRAAQRGDHRAAAKYYSALTKAVPGSGAPFVRLCAEYEAAGDRSNALRACANVLTRAGVTVEDFRHYVGLVLAEREPISPERIKDLDALMQHLDTVDPDSLVPAELRCDIGVRLLDVKRLTECTTTLHLRAPNDAKTLSYEWVLAMQRHDYEAAAHVVQRAKHSAMPAEAVQAMERTMQSLRAESAIDRIHERPLLGATVIAIVLLLIVAFIFKRRRFSALASTSSFLVFGGKANPQSTQEP